MGKRSAFLVVAALALCSVGARADLIPIGDPVDGDSFHQQFRYEANSSFDRIVVTMVVGALQYSSSTFSYMFGFSDDSWSRTAPDHGSYGETSDSAEGKGDSTTYLDLNLNFHGSSFEDNVSFHLDAYYGDEHKESEDQEFNHDDRKWRPCSNGGVVPEPFSMAFLASAFVGMVGVRVRQRRKEGTGK